MSGEHATAAARERAAGRERPADRASSVSPGTHALRRAVLRGGLPALATVGVSALLAPGQRLELHAILLACAAAIYLGVELAGEPRTWTLLEAVVGFGFVGVALAGLWVHPALLPAGWVLHAGWDTVHHRVRIPEGGGAWYPTACLLYDLVLAAYLTAWLAGGPVG